MIKRRKIRWMAVILVSALTVAHFQAVGASTMNKAKNEKKKAEEELNQANQKIEDIERQQSALQSEIDQKDAELVNLLVNIGILEDELTNKNKLRVGFMKLKLYGLLAVSSRLNRRGGGAER